MAGFTRLLLRNVLHCYNKEALLITVCESTSVLPACSPTVKPFGRDSRKLFEWILRAIPKFTKVAEKFGDREVGF